MSDCSNRKSRYAMLGLLFLAACSNAPATLSNANQYVRIGVLPAYEPEITRLTPPGLFTNAVIDRFDLDFGLNALVVDRVTKFMSRTHKVVDLQSFSAAYIKTPKVHSIGQRKIFGDSRPLLTDVVRSNMGTQGLDAYVVIEGGPVQLYERLVVPAIQLLATQPHDLSINLTIYIIDGRTFEIAAISRADLIQKGVPSSWFVAPRQHVDEIKNVLVNLVDTNLEPALRKLGLN